MASTPSLTLLLALLLPLIPLAVAAPEKHLVTHLPGFDSALPSKHYAGYITVDESNGRRLFYYLVLSERDPAIDPVVLWLNGAPAAPASTDSSTRTVWIDLILPLFRTGSFFCYLLVILAGMTRPVPCSLLRSLQL